MLPLLSSTRRDAEFRDVRFLPNSSVALLLDAVASKYSASNRPREYVAGTNTHRMQFGSAVCCVWHCTTRTAALGERRPCLNRTSRARAPLPLPPLLCRAFVKAREYVKRFGGAVSLTDAAALDELYDTLRHLSFVRESADGEITKVALHEYQIVALSNLNPATKEAARALIPTLDIFTDDEIGEMLVILRRATSRYGMTATDAAVTTAAAAATTISRT